MAASIFPKNIDLSNSEQKQVENWQRSTPVKLKSNINAASRVTESILNAGSIVEAFGEGFDKGVIDAVTSPFYLANAVARDPSLPILALAKLYMAELYALNHPAEVLHTVGNKWNNFIHSDARTQAKTLGGLTTLSLTGLKGV